MHAMRPSRACTWAMLAIVAVITVAHLVRPTAGILIGGSPVTGPPTGTQYQAPADLDTAVAAKSTLTITSPPELAGVIVWAQSPYTGPMFTVSDADAAAGNYDLSFPIVMPPSSSTDAHYGCFNYSGDVNDEGQSLVGAMVIVERGGTPCGGFGAKIAAAEVSGAAALIIYNTADNLFIPRIGVVLDTNVTVMAMSYVDGYILYDWLQGRRDWFNATKYDPSTPMPSGVNYTLPLMGTVVGTGPIKTSEFTALRTIAGTITLEADWVPETSTLRSWQDMIDNPTLDPCLNRVIGIYCERGHLQSVFLQYLGMTGTFDPAWGQFPNLQYLALSENVPDSVGLTGAVPAEICHLTNLLVLETEGNALTSLPDCMGTDLTQLLGLLMDRNALTNLPSNVSGWASSMVWLTVPTNQLTVLPSNMNLLTQMGALDVSLNSLALDASTISFAGWYQVTSINLASCALTGSLVSSSFTGLSGLLTFDASSNSLSGALPDLSGMSAITTLTLSDNKLTGGLPISWAPTTLTTIMMDSNRLTGPLAALKSMTALTVASFKSNQIVVPASFSSDVGAMLASMVGPALLELYLGDNQIAGTWLLGWLLTGSVLTKLSMPNNGLQRLPVSIWNTPMTYYDFSYNSLSGSIASDINTAAGKSPVTDFKIEGNPNLVAWPLPSWLIYATPITYTTSSDGYYECKALDTGTSSTSLRITFDPTFTEYNGCICAKGRFGVPPYCDVVPVTATINPYGLRVTSNETTMQASDSSLFATLLTDYDNSTNGALTLTTGARATVLPPSFTDDWYGQDRLTVGLSTYFSIDLTGVRLASGSTTESTGYASVNGTLVSGTASLQPVRIITVRLHISTHHFTGLTNLLAVSEGTRDNQGTVVFSILGSDNLTSHAVVSAFTQRAEYIARYGTIIAALNDSKLIEVQVLSNAATVYFQSRDSANRHFVATYSYDFVCPTGQELRQLKGLYLCSPVLQSYDLSVRSAVYFMVALALAFIIANAIVLGIKWNAPIYRASSRLFVSMILFFLATMAVGAIQYAVEPDVNSTTGPGVCIGRAWLSAMPLAGILAVLLVKTWRLYKIFCSTVIKKVTNASDGDLLRTIGVVCLLEAILLIIFSALELSKPNDASVLSYVETTYGVFPKYRIVKCSQEDGFVPWMVVQLIVVFFGMAAASFLSFKTRHIPTAFNESSHIMACCAVMLFFFIMIVPIDLLIQDRPEVGVLVQGFGQAFLAFAIAVMLIGPKSYIALLYSEKDQTAMTKEISSGPSANVSTRGSITTAGTSSSGGTMMASRASVTTPSASVPRASVTGAGKPNFPAASKPGERGSVAFPATAKPIDRSSIIGGATGPKFAAARAMPVTDKPKSSASVRPSFVGKPLPVAANPRASTIAALPTKVKESPLVPSTDSSTTPPPHLELTPVSTPSLTISANTTAEKPNASNDEPGAAVASPEEFVIVSPASTSDPAPEPVTTTPVVVTPVAIAPVVVAASVVVAPIATAPVATAHITSTPVAAPAPVVAAPVAIAPIVAAPMVRPAAAALPTLPPKLNIHFRVAQRAVTLPPEVSVPATAPAPSPSSPLASPSSPLASPRALIPSSPLLAPYSPSSAAPSAAPSSPLSAPRSPVVSPTPLSPIVGDSALDFVRRLRSRLPAPTAPNSDAPASSPALNSPSAD